MRLRKASLPLERELGATPTSEILLFGQHDSGEPESMASDIEYMGCDWGRLAYWHRPARTGSARWVVFLHGAGVDHREFDGQNGALSERDHVVMYDLRAHGESRLASGKRVHFDDFVKDLGLLLNHLGVERAVLIGHSFGGDVAQEFSWRYPYRVEKLVTIGSPGLQRRATRKERVRTWLMVPLLHVMPWRRFATLCGRVSSDVPETQAYIAGCVEQLPRQIYIDMGVGRLGMLHDAGPDTPHIPTLLVRGENDMPTLLDPIYASLQAQTPHARVAIIPESAHQCMQDQPAVFNAELVRFLSADENSTRAHDA